MFSLNRAQVIGNLTRDPEVRTIPSGQQVASFSVATNRRWTNASGEQQDDTQYHEVVAWGKLAEISQQILGKGKKVYVEGRLQTRSWEGQDGVKRNRTEIVAENIIALSPRDMGTGDSDFLSGASSESTPKSTSSSKKGPTKAQEASQNPPDEDEGEIKLEDIPF